jgi:hypothetical protein
MGSKASGKHYTSKGERKSSMKTADRSAAQKILNITSAYWKGQNPWVVIDNPNREETARRKIKVRAEDLWGNPKTREKQRFIMM